MSSGTRRWLERLEKELQKACRRKNSLRTNAALIQQAVSDPYVWVTQYTETYNPHWVEERRASSYEHFPPYEEYPHLYDLFQGLPLERIHFIEKSRDLMISWGCVAFLTNKAMTVPARDVLFQTQKLEKVKQLIKYARTLYERQPKWLKDAFPLGKHQSDTALRFAHGGGVYGIAGGADQIRSYHPWGYLLDEASFVPDAGDCYNQALSVVSGLIILNSSAGPGWYADVRHDVICNQKE
jgi:hypothetical protein